MCTHKNLQPEKFFRGKLSDVRWQTVSPEGLCSLLIERQSSSPTPFVFARGVNLGHCILLNSRYLTTQFVFIMKWTSFLPVVFFVMVSRLIFQRLFVVQLFYFKLCIIFLCLQRPIKECSRSLNIFNLSSCSCFNRILEISSPYDFVTERKLLQFLPKLPNALNLEFRIC